jgi:hypothetical protein
MSFFSSAFQDLKKAATVFKNWILTAASDAPKVVADIQKAEPTIEGITALFAPGAEKFEEVAINLLEVVGSAIDQAGAAASANGISVTLDAQLIAEAKTVWDAIKTFSTKSS